MISRESYEKFQDHFEELQNLKRRFSVIDDGIKSRVRKSLTSLEKLIKEMDSFVSSLEEAPRIPSTMNELDTSPDDESDFSNAPSETNSQKFNENYQKATIILQQLEKLKNDIPKEVEKDQTTMTELIDCVRNNLNELSNNYFFDPTIKESIALPDVKSESLSISLEPITAAESKKTKSILTEALKQKSFQSENKKPPEETIQQQVEVISIQQLLSNIDDFEKALAERNFSHSLDLKNNPEECMFQISLILDEIRMEASVPEKKSSPGYLKLLNDQVENLKLGFNFDKFAQNVLELFKNQKENKLYSEILQTIDAGYEKTGQKQGGEASVLLYAKLLECDQKSPEKILQFDSHPIKIILKKLLSEYKHEYDKNLALEQKSKFRNE